MSSTDNNDFADYPITRDMDKFDNPWLPKLDVYEYFNVGAICLLQEHILLEKRELARNRLAQTDIGREDYLFMKVREHLIRYLCIADAHIKFTTFRLMLIHGADIDECNAYFDSCLTEEPEDKKLGYSLSQHRVYFGIICFNYFHKLCCRANYRQFMAHKHVKDAFVKFLCKDRLCF